MCRTAHPIVTDRRPGTRLAEDMDDPQLLRLPPRAVAAERAPFPLIGSVAPVVVALLIWSITRSPFVLLFALLGPCIAVGSLADARRSSHKALARAKSAESRALDDLLAAVHDLHDREREAAWALTPSARHWLSVGDDDAGRFARIGVGPLVLGAARVSSRVRVSPDEPGTVPDERRQALVLAASSLDGMPLTADPRRGIGIVGPRALCRSLAYGLLIQACSASAPESLRIRLPPGEVWDWAAELPHRQTDAATVLQVVDSGGRADDSDAVIVLAEAVRDLPAALATVIAVAGTNDARMLRADQPLRPVLPELLGRAQAEHAAMALARASPARARPLAPRVAFDSLVQPAADEPGLVAAIGRDRDGDIRIDLAADGPHAVIGGTTGSGKSELLVTWITAMAARLPPDRFTFLLVDFKGGATATPLAGLPHCVGVASDLDEELVGRVLISLGAELKHRERLLAAAGVADIRELPTLARLVVVVDEFAALVASAPDAQARLTDIAARGRSLGVHLVLCTQRPAGVMRDALLANCGLRIALRVIDAPDSVAIVGTDAAARLPAGMPGRCVVSRHGERVTVQAAVTTAADIAAVARGTGDRVAGASGVPPRRPWLPPLPVVLGGDHPFLRGELGAGVVLGLVDEPEAQRQSVVRWSPREHGNLLVVGGRGCGASSILRLLGDTLELPDPPRDEEELWDALADPQDGGDNRILLIDDWDALSARLSPEYRQAAIDALAARLRSWSGGVALVTRRPAQLGALSVLFGRTLVLRVDDRAEHAAVGAPTRFWHPDAPPGRGVWNGSLFQAVIPQPSRPRPAGARVGEVSAGVPLLVVAAAPNQVADRIAAAWPGRPVAAPGRESIPLPGGDQPPVLLTDPEGWLALGSTLSRLRQNTLMVFDGCSLADVRQLTGTRALPPALMPGASRVWLRHPDGRLERGRWPAQANAADGATAVSP